MTPINRKGALFMEEGKGGSRVQTFQTHASLRAGGLREQPRRRNHDHQLWRARGARHGDHGGHDGPALPFLIDSETGSHTDACEPVF